MSLVKTLRVENISKSFRGRKVVDKVSFQVNSSEIVGILGPNGAGKTTSFYMVVGLAFPDTGKVFLDDRDITLLPMHERARVGISYLPQNASVFKKLSVQDNLLAIMEVVGISVQEQKNQLEELLDRFRISHIRSSLGVSLSGGERRRVEIARALITKPDFLLLDEPFAGVDPLTVEEIQKLIFELSLSGLGVLITDHNVRETLSTCSRAYIVSRGSVVASGSPEEVSKNPQVRDVYLGQNFVL